MLEWYSNVKLLENSFVAILKLREKLQA